MGPFEDLEIRRRSLAMLPPGSDAFLKREEALTLMERLQKSERRIVELERLVHDAECRHPSSGG